MTNKLIHIVYIIYYQIHLLICFIFRPTVYGSYVAVWCEGKILIIKNSYKKFFTVPCGSIDKGETPIEAAVRELYEETGIKAETSELTLFKTYLNLEEYKKDNIHFYEIYLKNIPEIIVDNREVIWGEFLDPKKALEKSLFTPVKLYLTEKN